MPTEIDILESQLASAERGIAAARETLRWATGTDKHWKAEGVLSGLVGDYYEQYHNPERQEDARHREAHSQEDTP